MVEVTPPRSVAKRMIRLCEKLFNDGEAALSRAKEQQSPLRARRYDIGRAGRGNVSNQTADVGCARAERDSKTLYESFVGAMNDLDRSILRVDGLYERIMGTADRSEANRKMRQPGAGHCVACQVWMPGTRKERIISGLCPTHYQGYHRAVKTKGITRAEYIAKVRARKDKQDEDEVPDDEDA